MGQATVRQGAGKNRLYYGDNLDILQREIADESVDLVYLDPPFQSGRNYNILFEEKNGSASSAQIKAFEDTWHWTQEAAALFQQMVEGGPERVSQALQGFRMFLGENDMMAYLAMLAPRLVELRRVLKDTGSIYLHCDPTASHYLKMLVDSVFGAANYRNEIVWCYAGGGIPRRDFPRKHDVILRYTKCDEYFFQPIYRPYSPGTVQRGRTAVKGKYAKAGLRKEGTPVNDWWPDVPKITSPTDPEKLGYPTQKSEALLERIIRASSSQGDTVLDPFCGCGTAVAVAQRLNRHWIGIDITHLAVNLIKYRLRDAFGEGVEDTYEVIGEPTDLAGAQQLAAEDPWQFQFWALGLVEARPVEEKKGADRGIDGRIYFHDEAGTKKTKQIILQVKAGKTGVKHVRDLRGVIEREEAAIGVLITMRAPTRPMEKEAAAAGFYRSPGWRRDYPRLQILTIEDLFSGKQIKGPPRERHEGTFKRGPKAKRDSGQQDFAQ